MPMQKLPMAKKWVASAPGTTTMSFGDVSFTGPGINMAGAQVENLGQMEEYPERRMPTWLRVVGWVGTTAGTGLGAYYGYKKYDSVWSATWRGLLSGIFWPFGIPISAAAIYKMKK